MQATQSLRVILAAVFATASAFSTAQTTAQTVAQTPAALSAPSAMALENVPPVPASVAAQVAKYTEFKPTFLADWHPSKKELMVVRRHKNTAQLYRVAKPGAPLELLTDYPEPVNGARYHP